MIRSILVALAVLAASDASAHGLNIFVRDEVGTFKGNVYFTGGDPAKHVTVTISGADGQKVAEVVTDDAGDFSYMGPRPSGTVVFVAATSDGHRAEAELRGLAPVESETPRLVQANVATMKSYEAELTDIHRAIDELENRLWLRDVIGGIGYIFGLAGLWALWKSRTRGNRH